MNKNNSTFSHDLHFGIGGENLLKGIINGDFKCEVKRDRKLSYTGNLAIEVEYKGKPSGLAKTEAEWYAFVCSGSEYKDELIIFISTERLKKLCDDYENHGGRVVYGGDYNASKLILLPLEKILDKI